ncbi:MAG TPA: GspE/PulE family protein [Anaerohalosphaeraceae bacterium]|jgi:type IV pilus assembly protein PilB|nr:GspE/PulE family protein [Anaerohalosphaeraceae bacterium]
MSVKAAFTDQNQTVVEVLRQERILSDEQIEDLLSLQAQTGHSLVHLLREKEWIEEDQLTRLTALSNGIDYIELTPEMVDPVAMKLVPLEAARRHVLIPLRIEQDCLLVAMSSPLNLSVREMITTRTGYRVRPVAAGAEAIRRALQNHFNVESLSRQDIVAMRLQNKPGQEKKSQSIRNQSIKSADAPVVRLVETILTGGIENRASDIHLEPQQPDMKVRYRIDGLLQDALQVPSSAERQVISHIKILADMDISEKRLPQDGHISMVHGGKLYDLRISSLPAVGGEKIVIRILDTETGLQALEDLVSRPEDLQKFKTLLDNPHGMILLTGPTGCGKTTTLYSMIRSLHRVEHNIVTVEDPVEYQIPGITQVQVKPDIHLTFASCLRSILRQDPDIILVGEIRDEETAEIAVSASLTGHLVLSTLHTNNAVGVVSRLVNLEIPAYQAASALLGVVSQRLVRTLCHRCRIACQPTQKEMEILELSKADSPKSLYKSQGCEYCRHTGYCGRTAVYEIFLVTPEIRHLIVAQASEDALKEEAIRQGMMTLRMQAIHLIKKGRTTMDEAMRVIDLSER